MKPFGMLLAATALQMGLYVLVPAWALAREKWRDAGERWFGALAAGVGTAALLGRMCNGSGIGAGWALCIWLAAWLAAGATFRRKGVGDDAARRWDWPLAFALMLAWAVRSIHPLETWALGQSDAYSHLGFLMDVLGRGRVANPDYPPAYAWAMALPARLLPGHPYWMARFGGAFYGAGLVLGVYALSAQWKGRAAGLAAAGLAAGCPIFYLLQKTGVGSFANQMGLLMLVAALWSFSTRRYGWLVLAMAALAVSVPMMALHLALLLGLWTFAERRPLSAHAGLLGLGLLGCIGLAALSLRMPPERGMAIASMLTGDYALAKAEAAGWGEVFRALASDYFEIKRLGYGSPALNAAALASVGLFIGALAGGIWKRDAAWRLVGLWGLLTGANLHLGLFQFTDYQREGWSFLLAVACWSGMAFEGIWSWRVGRVWRMAWGALLAVSALGGLAFPPRHAILAGPAESDLVREALGMDAATTILVRRTSSFPGGQGDVVRTLHPRTAHSVEELKGAEGPIVFLRDRPPAAPEITFAMRMLQPRQIRTMEKVCASAELDAQRIERELEGRAARIEKITPHLDAWIMEGE